MNDGDQLVRDQYEAYPYPARDPADEAHRLITGSPSHILEIEHFIFAGGCAGNLRALVAGGGTGDGTIMLAQQLADRGAGTVTYLDMSAASLAIARARAKARGLKNITFHQGSLLDLPGKGWQAFDYIDCCGVLHHLSEPGEGMATLVSVLASGGGLGLMLYGELGRIGVYPMQRAIARLAGQGSVEERLAFGRHLISAMPASNWLKRNEYLADHLVGGDAGFSDLLLHSRDRAYLVGEVLDLLNGAGLRATGFSPLGAYDPVHYLDDAQLVERVSSLSQAERWALAEELSGALKTHVFYAVRHDDVRRGAPAAMTPELVPALRDMDPKRLAAGLSQSPRLTATLGGVERTFQVPGGVADMISLIDGRRTLRQIQGRLRARGAKLNWVEFLEGFSAIYDVLHPLNIILFAGAVLD